MVVLVVVVVVARSDSAAPRTNLSLQCSINNGVEVGASMINNNNNTVHNTTQMFTIVVMDQS